MGALESRGARLNPGRLLPRAALFVCAPALLTAFLFSLPWAGLEVALDGRPGVRITDRNGALLALMPGREGSFQLRLAPTEIPAACAEIFIRLEDRRFRAHPGVDLLALLRASVRRVDGSGARSGASTITMQLARLVHPHPRGLGGKIVEAFDALRLESRFTKDRILALYLNEIPFGRNTRGVGAAAWTYFGADLSTLSAAQLLALAIVPRNPTAYDPIGNPEALIAAATNIDARLRLDIPPGEIVAAVRGAHAARPSGGAPHFARYVTGLIGEGALIPDEGRIRTTLDLGLNESIEARVRFVLDRYAEARVTNAAVVVLDNLTGGVLGWVGSRDFQDRAHAGQIDGALIRRQSASTLKPFLYASAIQGGWTAATLLPDAPMVFGAADEESFRPQNFDRRSHGAVRLRTALASSLNVPAVYTLAHVGLPSFFGTLRSLGFALPPDAARRYGLGTAVGNAEVSLLELTHAFSVFPRGGTLLPVEVTRGGQPPALRIFDPFSAWIVVSILSDPSARVTGFGTHTYFRTPFPAMFKSGTSSEFTNLWCVGATPLFTVGVWAGNFDGRAVIGKTGSIVPTQILTDVLTRVSSLMPGAGTGRDFARPSGAVEARICTDTGEAASAGCGTTRIEYFRNVKEIPRPGTGSRSPDELLQRQFLDDAHPVRILFPVSGQVFYLDQTVASGTQGIPVIVAARNGLDIAVSYDGQEIAAGPYSSSITVALTRGLHSITVTGAAGSDAVSFEVR